MPTLMASAAACIALVIAVGLQAPAVSVGLRWVPGPRSRTLDLIPIESREVVEPARAPVPEADWSTWVACALALLVIVACAFYIVRWIRRRASHAPAMNVAQIGADTDVLTEAGAQILQSGLAAAMDILASHGDLGNAVVQAWQGLEDAAADAGLHRRPAETASEFTARILYRSRNSAEPIAMLLALYQRVRFGGHAPHADDIASARQSLVVLMNLWRADFPLRRPTTRTR